MIRYARLVSALAVVFAAQAALADGVLIRCARPCTKEIAAVKKAGGTVTYEYKYVDGIAAEIPARGMRSIEKLVGSEMIEKDEIIPVPASVPTKDGVAATELEADDVGDASAEDLLNGAGNPDNYTSHAELTGVAELHAQGYLGAGEVIAIIDSGYRPMFNHVHPSRVVSPGVNMVPGASEPPAISNLNGPHGTQVAGMAAANIGFCFNANTVRLARAALDLGVASTTGCTAPSVLLPMIGGAPGARILPVKVFPAAGGGSPTSRTIAAMEAVLDLRKKYDAGDPAGYNIRVVNLSLGGGTSIAGRSLSDRTIDKLIENDILPVVSAGNEGFSAVTGGSPGTSMSALTVGAAATAIHEWVYTAQFRAPCGTAPIAQVTHCAKLYRSDANTQMAAFSSRGPTHDGRVKPDVVANGSYGYTQGSGTTATTVSFASGTSFSSPTVAGIATVLRQAVPSATARQVRNAIMMSANPALIPTAKPNDQGRGFIDAPAALQLLLSGSVPDTVETFGYTRNLQANMSRAGVPVHTESASISFSGIRPAEIADVPFLVPANSEAIFIRVRNIVGELPLAQQNPFFTDDVYLRIQGAGVHRKDYKLPGEAAFLTAGQEYLYSYSRPETGVWRISPSGDWTNAGSVSFDVDVWVTQEPWPQHTVSASIGHRDQHAYEIVVPAGTASLNVRAEWSNMSGHYPINDVDVILVNPSNTAVFSCATGRTPEICSVSNPAAGTWQVVVDGFSVSSIGTPGGKEKYTVRIDADGEVLKTSK